MAPRGAPVTEIVFVVEEAPEGGYVARSVGASIHTEADTLEMFRTAIREAVACHFEEGHGPRVIRLHVVRDELLAP
jgi:hypothetical protein